jgi:hypothetical protein
MKNPVNAVVPDESRLFRSDVLSMTRNLFASAEKTEFTNEKAADGQPFEWRKEGKVDFLHGCTGMT